MADGGGLGIANAQSVQTGSKGGTGTSYGAGGGGGGTARHSNSYQATPSNASSVIGGNGAIHDGSYYINRCSAGGGAGCNPGTGRKSKDAISCNNGNVGTGGLLIVYAKNLNLNTGASFISTGQKGGNAVAKKGNNTSTEGSASAGGAGSGGGSINIFMENITLAQNTTISSYINVAGGAGGVGSGGDWNATGGKGGTGSANIGYINTGDYKRYYSNN